MRAGFTLILSIVRRYGFITQIDDWKLWFLLHNGYIS